MIDLISRVTSKSSMHLLFDKLYTIRQKKPSLKALIVLSVLKPERLEELIQDKKKLSKDYKEITLTLLEQEFYKLHLKKEIRGEYFKVDALVDISNEGSWVIFTNEKRYFVKHVLEAFFDGLYPEVSRVYFNYSQIQRFLDIIRDAYRGQSILTHIAIRRKPRKPIKEEARKGTLVLWELGAEEELKRQSKAWKIWIDRLSFDVKGEAEMLLLQASITGNGLCGLKYGNFTAFYNNVILNLINLGFYWRDFYSKRERRVENGFVKLRPYSIRYPFEFEEEHLARLPEYFSRDYLCSVIHGGNPYFVANLCDYQDGSSFGLTILSNVVTVTPMLRATPSALWKLSSRIQEFIGEGEIIDVTI